MAVNLLGMQNLYLARLPNDHETTCKHHLGIKNVWKYDNSYDLKVFFIRKCIKIIFFILKKLFWQQYIKKKSTI